LSSDEVEGEEEGGIHENLNDGSFGRLSQIKINGVVAYSTKRKRSGIMPYIFIVSID
jgi:hypothetical protein